MTPEGNSVTPEEWVERVEVPADVPGAMLLAGRGAPCCGTTALRRASGPGSCLDESMKDFNLDQLSTARA